MVIRPVQEPSLKVLRREYGIHGYSDRVQVCYYMTDVCRNSDYVERPQGGVPRQVDDLGLVPKFRKFPRGTRGDSRKLHLLNCRPNQ